MGAYYMCALKQKDDETYTIHEKKYSLKLLEHSYIYDSYLLEVKRILFEKKFNVIWLCDYCEDKEINWDKLSKKNFSIKKIYESILRYLYNHTKKVYIDYFYLEGLYRKYQDDNWFIDPLPILTNSEIDYAGGGDYSLDDARRGSWKGDLLEVVYDHVETYKDVTHKMMFFENKIIDIDF